MSLRSTQQTLQASFEHQLQKLIEEKCASIALRECAAELRGERCFNCRPLLIGIQTHQGVRFVSFQPRPLGPQ